jgi:hypothetical protein
MLHGWKLLFSLLAGLALSCAAQAQTTLRYKFKQGDKFDYLLEQNQKSVQRINDRDVNVNSKMVIKLTWETLEVDAAGKASVKVMIGRVKMTTDSDATGKAEVDSMDTTEPEDGIRKILWQTVRSMSGREISFGADPTGEFKDFKFPQGKKQMHPRPMGQLPSCLLQTRSSRCSQAT